MQNQILFDALYFFKMKSISLLIQLTIICNCVNCQPNIDPKDWCNHQPREAFSKLPEIKIPGNWFKVYNVGDDVIAIVEPYNFEEVISYLVLGKEKALLFDT